MGPTSLIFLHLLPIKVFTYECSFRQQSDSNSLGENERSGAFNTDLYQWPGHIVYYMFEESVSDDDKEIIEETMAKIEEHTCLTFTETSSRRRKTLIVKTEGRYPYCPACKYLGVLCPSRNGGTVRTDPFCTSNYHCPYVYQGATSMVLEFRSPFCGRLSRKFQGLILHELFHALGLIHTQARPDRDQYIKVNADWIKGTQLSQYLPICYGCQTFNLPYQCDSVMHYGYKDFAAAGRTLAFFLPTMTSVDESCSLTPDGGSQPTKIDWKMVNRAQRCPARFSQVDKEEEPIEVLSNWFYSVYDRLP